MTKPVSRTVIPNAWTQLRRLTPARIALGRAGISTPTDAHLNFQLAHAKARDAVHHALNADDLKDVLAGLDLTVVDVQSAVATRMEYLQRPDRGRRLDDASRAALKAAVGDQASYDVGIVIGDGLSALAIEQNAGPLLKVLVPAVRAQNWQVAPVAIAQFARVAIGDEIGALLGAKVVLVLIGERPGLSAADSLGVYMTFAPRPGLTDESRNCISNIRPEGLRYDAAAHKLIYLMREAFQRQRSGVLLKDKAETLVTDESSSRWTFLTGAKS